MKLHFKSRISFFNTIAAAITMLIVFAAVYAVVYISTYHYIDNNIIDEKNELFSELIANKETIVLSNNAEWEELEHNRAEADPVFLQIVNTDGMVIFHSQNLENDLLRYEDSLSSVRFFNTTLNNRKIRQGQFPILNKNGKIIGQLDIGVSQVDSIMILQSLRNTFFVTFPFMLIFFFIVTSLVASRSIRPVQELIKYAEKMNYNNINPQLPLPPHQDEIYQLATTINALLKRIENGRNREKQITSDISHELWTPLTSIKGTLEVLIRKTREPKQYQEKIEHVIQEVDSMNHTLNQLLYLARLDSGNINIIKKPVNLNDITKIIKNRWSLKLKDKQMSFQIDIPDNTIVKTDLGLLEIILGNLIGNAIKYGNNNGRLICIWNSEQEVLSICDNGPGIPEKDLPHIFERYYRVYGATNSSVQGTGLGLYLVKKFTKIQGIEISVKSTTDTGTKFDLCFKENLS